MDESSARDHYTEMLHQPWNPEVIRQAPDLEPGDEHPSVVEVQNFLKRFGYFIDAVAEGLTPERGRLDEVTVRALVDYQRFYSVGPDDGSLDASTRELMAAPRCGMPDVYPGPTPRYLIVCAWRLRSFSYEFGNVTTDVSVLTEFAKNAVRRAFATWAAAGVGLSFQEKVWPGAPADFRVDWRQAADPDTNMVGNIVAHSDFPRGCSAVTNIPPKPLHFDDEEHTWADGAVPGKLDIETVALHEIGHLMGLAHTATNPPAGNVMYAYNAGNGYTLRTLQADDLSGIRHLYPLTTGGIFAEHSDKVIDVAAFSQANGAKIQQWDWLGGPNQRFRLDMVLPSIYRIIAEHSGKVLTVEGWSTANGARIVQWDWLGGNNQRFRVEEVEGRNIFRIVAEHSGKVLDVPAFSQANGAQIQQWDWLNLANQRWRFR